MTRRTLYDLTFPELEAELTSAGHPAYRARQVWKGVYGDLAPTYDAITTLPAALRQNLSEALPLDALTAIDRITSEDGRTEKTLFRLADGASVETVAMTYEDRCTVCISSQVGCPMDCRLCATGRSGFVRNLSTGEVVAQVIDAARTFARAGSRLSNVVYMGMGEPFANYDATLRSIRILNDPQGFGLGARAFTVSTVGIVPAIDRFAGEGIQANLAISLHAARDDLRNQLVPVNRRYPLNELIAACRRYIDKTHRRVTFEIALIDGVNDSQTDALDVTQRLSGLLCHVNLIPFNAVPGIDWRGTPSERVHAFAHVLQESGIPTTIRISRGAEIQAGCGQLRSRHKRKTEPQA